jgi:hypothetical protein
VRYGVQSTRLRARPPSISTGCEFVVENWSPSNFDALE